MTMTSTMKTPVSEAQDGVVPASAAQDGVVLQSRRRSAKTSLRRRLCRAHLQEPWWFTEMRAQGLVPHGVPTEKLAGGGVAYPVILPSTQAVYILPKAVNAHLARTYAPLSRLAPVDSTTAKIIVNESESDDYGRAGGKFQPQLTYDDKETHTGQNKNNINIINF
jgi:hypothetical protein